MSSRMHSYVDTNGDIHYGFFAEPGGVERAINERIEEETLNKVQVNRKVTVTATDVTIEELIAALHGSCKEVLRETVDNIVGIRVKEPTPRKLTEREDFEGATVGTIVDTEAGPHMKIWKDKWLWIADQFGENRTNIDDIESDRTMSVDYTGTVLYTPEARYE